MLLLKGEYPNLFIWETPDLIIWAWNAELEEREVPVGEFLLCLHKKKAK